MTELFTFSAWCIGILNGVNKDSKPLDNYTKGGILVTAHLMMTVRKIFKSQTENVSSLGVCIASSIFIGSLYYTGHLLGKGIKHTIKDRIE